MFERLEKYFDKEIIEEVLSKYDEPWRYFHTRKHLAYIIEKIKLKDTFFSDKTLDILYLTTLFHDVVYLPWSNSNEEDSVEVFKKYWTLSKIQDNDISDSVIIDILDTKAHSKDNWFNKFDMYVVLQEKNSSILLEWEEGIFKEYAFAPYNLYKHERINFLNKYIPKNDALLFLKDYVERRSPRIGFYAGSFNPFHKGHLSIANQGKEIFDKVVLLIGQNASKAPISKEEASRRKADIFDKTGMEVEFFDGLLPDYIKNRCEKTGEQGFLIRGLRNEDDFKSEQVQAWYMKSVWNDLKIIYLSCPAEYGFISSSGIKAMNSAKEGSGDIFLPEKLF
jgi:pantetheine-phosphate adenylyltransferase